MITTPSEKDEVYLSNVAKIGNSIDNIQYLENVLSKDEHNTILNFVTSYESWGEEPWNAMSILYDKIPKEILEMLYKVFMIAHQKSIDLYGVQINPLDRYKFNLFKFVEGFSLNPHIDTLSVESNHIASVYYINDDYTGGEINFPDHNLKIKPKANSLIIFPGNENYTHEVYKVVGKDRYSSSKWFQFTGSNFNKKNEWYD